jgi:hypothetical protein
MAAPKVLVATESFSTDVLGHPRTVTQGETFREGHVITEAHPGGFEEWTIDNEVEQATAAPGERRAKRTPRTEETAESTED